MVTAHAQVYSYQNEDRCLEDMTSGKRLFNEGVFSDVWELAVRSDRDYFIKGGQCYKLKPGARKLSQIALYLQGTSNAIAFTVGGVALAESAPAIGAAAGSALTGTELAMQLSGNDSPVDVATWLTQEQVLYNARNPCNMYLTQTTIHAPGVPPNVVSNLKLYNDCMANTNYPYDMPSENYDAVNPPPPPAEATSPFSYELKQRARARIAQILAAHGIGISHPDAMETVLDHVDDENMREVILGIWDTLGLPND